MMVFKLYLKILKRNLTTILVFLGIFVALILIAMGSFNSGSTSFKNVKVDVAYIDHDQSDFTKDLKTYLSDYANFEEIEEDALEDAFFYRDILMIIEIPDGFSQSLTTGEPLKIEVKSVPDSASTMTLETTINKYINLSAIYLRNDLSTDDVIQAVRGHLSKGAEVNVTVGVKEDYESVQFYYNYLAYVILALVITVMGSIMISYKPIDIVRRNNVSAVSNKKMNLLLICGNLMVGLFFSLVLVIVSIGLFKDLMFKTNGLLYMLNAFIFTLSVIALAYLLVTLFNSRNVISALGTILSLGFSFITGIFIPQFLLGDTILSVAKFIPSYWYVAANDRLVTLGQYNSTTMKPILTSFLVQLGFTVIFIILAIFVSQKKQRAEN